MKKSNNISKINKILCKNTSFFLILIFIFDFGFYPSQSKANDGVVLNQENTLINSVQEENEKELKKDEEIYNNDNFSQNLPENDSLKISYKKKVSLTAYNSEVGQCDNSPCTTATGFNVCEHNIEDTIAANFLPFGTKVRIPSLFGDRIFVVRDRMNSRYTNKVDVWMKSKFHARMFGVQYAEIEVLK